MQDDERSLEARLAVELRRVAMDLLARREHARRELETKLTRRLPRLLEAELARRERDGLRTESDDPAGTAGNGGQGCDDDVITKAAPERWVDVDTLIAGVLDDLASDRLQSDARYVEARVHSSLGRGHGPLKIRAGLSGQALDDELVREALEIDDDTWREQLARVLERRFGSTPPADRRDWARRARFAASRGFPERLVRDALGAPPWE